jgi:hypothetical protein
MLPPLLKAKADSDDMRKITPRRRATIVNQSKVRERDLTTHGWI